MLVRPNDMQEQHSCSLAHRNQNFRGTTRRFAKNSPSLHRTNRVLGWQTIYYRGLLLEWQDPEVEHRINTQIAVPACRWIRHFLTYKYYC